MKQGLLIIFFFVALLIVNGCRSNGNETSMQINTSAGNRTIETSENNNEIGFTAPEYQYWNPMQTECEKCIDQCLRDFQSIRPGMTRHEVMQKFLMDGGLQTVSPVRFLHPQCRSFKVDVSFTYERDPENQNRAIMGKDDKVIEISRPYLEPPFMD